MCIAPAVLSHRGSHGTANIDMNAVPPHLKCALSNTLLKEAVTLPCCNKVGTSSA